MSRPILRVATDFACRDGFCVSDRFCASDAHRAGRGPLTRRAASGARGGAADEWANEACTFVMS